MIRVKVKDCEKGIGHTMALEAVDVRSTAAGT
jgi:hypothetical protein